MNFPRFKISAPARLCWIVWAFIFCAQFTVLGPVMHETDQASLLSGAWKLAHADADPLNASFYNYDKQFLSYAYVALWLKILPGADPVLVGNLSTFCIFWIALACLLWRHPPRTFPQAAIVSAVLLSPALWQHSAFLASNFLSAALLILGFCLWSPSAGWRRVAAVALFAGAVAARADALAALPAVAWILLPRRQWLRSPWLWAIAIAGGLAFFAGRPITESGSRDVYPLFFHPKVYVAYTLFGLGATAAVLAWWTIRGTAIALSRQQLSLKIHYALGAAALLPIFLYYSVQMFSTRHWTILIAALLVFAVAKKSRLIFRSSLLAALILTMAIGPVFIGLQLPSPTQPRLTFGPGTAFPSADGNLTMGGYLPRLLEMRRLHFAHDHNHPLWEAARQTQFAANAQGEVPFLFTPMFAYYELASTLQGKTAIRVSADAPTFYVDSRSVLRYVPAITGEPAFTAGHLMLSHRLTPVSPSGQSYRMWRAEPGDPTPEILTWAKISAAFEGNEFRVLSRPEEARDSRWRGHRIVLSRNGEFRAVSAKELAAMPDPDLNQSEAAVSILPEYMSVRNLD